MDKKSLVIILLIIILIAAIIGFIYYRTPPSDGSDASGASSTSNIPPITEQDLKAGFYWGFQDQKKPGTPDNWTWHEAGISSGWSAPK